MANKKITELNEATTVSGNDWLVIVDVANDETKKVHANLVGGNIPIQDTPPQDPEDDDLWIDTSEPEEMQEAIKNEYSTSTADTYSCDYVNKAFGGVELYSGNSASTITLNDTTKNYKYVEIYGYATNSAQTSGNRVFTKIINAWDCAFYLIGTDIDSSNATLYLKCATCTINSTGTQISFAKNYQWYQIGGSTTGGGSANDFMRITKVIGYK